ncbi:hypothetical protein R50072_27720 [Simiduia litorea]|uniref:hypothetical protein n=1 Tax=Simiduia litorea TaxID=1435348 RepID=UPI0036F25101
MKMLGVCAVVFLVAGCNGIDLSANVGPYAKNTAKSWVVKEYQKDDIMRYNAEALGLVEASECQAKPGGAKPSRSALIKELKVKAMNKDANGLVVEQCATDTVSICTAYLMCWGMAYRVPTKQSRP